MERELVGPIERHRHGDGDATPGFPIEAWARPDLAPRVSGDQVLEFFRQRRRRRLRPIDIFIPKHFTTDLRATLTPLVVVHPSPFLPRYAASARSIRTCATPRYPD